MAARNILLDKVEICKVADFGLSREVVDDEYNVQKVSVSAIVSQWNFVCLPRPSVAMAKVQPCYKTRRLTLFPGNSYHASASVHLWKW